MRILFATLVVLGLAAPAYVVACPDKAKHEKTAEVSAISVADAARLAKKGEIIMVDANKPATRKAEGVVPGARLLTSYRDFEVEELRASKGDTLVFYCFNESCGAAPAAARHAASKGFTARVMEAGIKGWKKAGNPVKKI